MLVYKMSAMNYWIRIYSLVVILCDTVLSEKTIYERVLLKKANAALAANPNVYLSNRYQQQSPIRYVYVYPEETGPFPTNPTVMDNNLRPPHQKVSYNTPPSPPHQHGSMTRGEYVKQYNKLKQDIAKFLPTIMRTLTTHNLPAANAGTSPKIVEYVSPTVATYQVNPPVVNVAPKPLPLYIIPSVSPSRASPMHNVPISHHYQTRFPVVPKYSFVPVPTVYRTPSVVNYESTPLDPSNDRDYYRRPNYEELSQTTDTDEELAPSEYAYQFLDGEYVVSNRRSVNNIPTESASYSHFDTDDQNKQGYKTSNGYQRSSEFHRRSKGNYDEANEDAIHNDSGSRESNSYEVSEATGIYGDEDTESNGGEFREKSKHRKGSETTGYHNVYHKDEYVKDHIFYDEAEHSGHYRRFGKSYTQSENDESKRKEDLSQNAGHANDLQRNHDLYTKGYYESDKTSDHHGKDQNSEQRKEDEDGSRDGNQTQNSS